jgi:serine/threonine protein kinase
MAEHSRLAILQAKGLACSLDKCSQDILYVFVDVQNSSDGGVLTEVPFQLAPGTITNIALPDKNSGQWKFNQARVVWSRKGKHTHIFHTGMQYLSEDEHGTEKIPWETDPLKPRPEDISFLIEAGLFDSISQVGISLILNSLIREEVKAGARFIRQGETGKCLYLVQKGTCTVFIEKQTDIRKIARLKPGDVVGEMAVLTGEPRTASVEAQTDMVLWKLNLNDFESLEHKHPDLRLFLTEIMAKRFDTSIFIGDRIIGKYLLTEKVGQGGWGIVYRGVHRLLKMPVAVKMMKHDMAMEPAFLDTFRREAETIARMRHPNIVSVYDIEEMYKTIFIIMEYLEGVSLKDYLKTMGSMPVELCVDVLFQICNGLSCAHSYNIVHRDIKPANIIILENNLVKLLDFGLACAPGIEDMSIAGTVYYAPPEQILGERVDQRSDVYSMGIMAYEMITGHRPYPEDNLADLMDMHCEQEIPDPALLIPDLPEELSRFIKKCCQRDPDQRYPNAHEAQKELLSFAPNWIKYPQSGSAKIERSLTSLFLFHDLEQGQELQNLLEEFGDKAAKLGVSMHMTEFKNI